MLIAPKKSKKNGGKYVFTTCFEGHRGCHYLFRYVFFKFNTSQQPVLFKCKIKESQNFCLAIKFTVCNY